MQKELERQPIDLERQSMGLERQPIYLQRQSCLVQNEQTKTRLNNQHNQSGKKPNDLEREAIDFPNQLLWKATH